MLCFPHSVSTGHLHKIRHIFPIINDVLCGCILNGICRNMSSTLKFMFFIIIFIICSKPGLALKSHPIKRTSSLTGMPACLVSMAYKIRSYFSSIFIFFKLVSQIRMIITDKANWMGKSHKVSTLHKEL